MNINVTLQPLFEKLAPEQRQFAEAKIKKTANRYQRAGDIPILVAMRIEAGRKSV